MKRRVTNEISQRDLDAEARAREHERQQNLHDVINQSIMNLVRLLPWIILVLCLTIFAGKVIFHFDTSLLENWLTVIISATAGYVLAYLRRSGIERD